MARRSHEARVDWKHVAIYGAVVAIVVVIGALAIWSFLEKQSLVIAPETLPKVTVVTPDADAKLAASWVNLLTKAGLAPTLVPPDKLEAVNDAVILTVSQKRGAFTGNPPLDFDEGASDPAFRLAEASSPLLARLNPGYELGTQVEHVAFLKESPRMVIDARWKSNARAAIMHMEQDGARTVWFGFEPDALWRADDPQLLLLLRTAFRWLAGQAVSDGAIGTPQVASTFTPAARAKARAARFAFSVDRLSDPNQLSVRMTNHGTRPLENPTVKIWLPPGVTGVALAGDYIMRRNATLTGAPEEGACLVALPSLGPNEDRIMKLKIVSRRSSGSATSTSPRP